MKLLHKRMLTLFSVALNIGFVIVAIAMLIHHPASWRDPSWLVGMVEKLDLPKDRELAVLDTIEQFRSTIDRHEDDINQARDDVIRLLAASGPVDRKQLHERFERVKLQENLKNKAFEAHVIDLRSQLGDEKGARFFSLMLEHVKSRHGTAHR